MENTSYNKQKFFALYWGQNIVADGLCPGDLCTVNFALSEGIVKEGWLELKPLSAISEEDELKVAELWTTETFYKDDIWQQVQDVFDYKTYQMPYTVADYLRSKCYALPYNGLSVDQQIEYGWVKLTSNR